MIETNLSEYFAQNLTMDNSPMTITGIVNNTMPVDLAVKGNITVVAHVPGNDLMLELMIMDTVFLIGCFVLLVIIAFGVWQKRK